MTYERPFATEGELWDVGRSWRIPPTSVILPPNPKEIRPSAHTPPGETAIPFEYRTTNAKKRCEGTFNDSKALAGWWECFKKWARGVFTGDGITSRLLFLTTRSGQIAALLVDVGFFGECGCRPTRDCSGRAPPADEFQ
jgi:hypothetical protein